MLLTDLHDGVAALGCGAAIKILTAKFERDGVAHSSDRYERESFAISMAALKALGSSIEKIIKQQDAAVEK